MPITVDTPEGKETLYYSACTPNCWMNCRLYAHVRDGKLVQTSAAPFPDSRYNRICLRGLSHPQRVYSKERLTKPLLRVGKRGENKWKEISWDEAFTLMANKLSEIKEKYGSQAVLFAPLSGNYAILNGSLAGATHRMANIFGGTLACDSIDLALATGESQVVANLGSGMTSWFLGHQPEDIANARTIVAWGTNVTESQVHNWHFFADALEKGATLICIDPRYSETAEKAHYWLRPRPGSDAALAMSMIDVVIEENLYDRSYVIDHTVGPFLVRSDNGKFLRRNDLDPDGDGSNLVFDEKSQSFVPVDTGEIAPALFGSFEAHLADGTTIQVRPAFQLLADQAAAYTPEQAEAITSVRPDLVREVTRIYVQNGPAFVYSGMGIDRGTMLTWSAGPSRHRASSPTRSAVRCNTLAL
ncbi:MAG: molybdopterin-dependent oxidoreductase [Firmicutes bacterium]|nr:molybdopterin-dependent oxidoreductase [Bacillota bacterium]